MLSILVMMYFVEFSLAFVVGCPLTHMAINNGTFNNEYILCSAQDAKFIGNYSTLRYHSL